MNLMNGPRTAREYVVWYPAVGNCPSFVCVGKGGIERLTTIATAPKKRRSETNAEYTHKERRFTFKHPIPRAWHRHFKTVIVTSLDEIVFPPSVSSCTWRLYSPGGTVFVNS